MTPAERSLLLAVFRWARSTGVRLDGAMRWTSPPPHRWGVDYYQRSDRDSDLHVYRTGQILGVNYMVMSVAEAVDVLVALGILPHRFSTAYRAGYDARTLARIAANASRLGWTDPAVAVMQPAADRTLAVRR